MRRILLLPGILALFVLVSCTSNSSLPVITAEIRGFEAIAQPDSVKGTVWYGKRVNWIFDVALINNLSEPLRLWGFTWTDYNQDGSEALLGDVNDPRLDRWFLRGRILQPGEVVNYKVEVERKFWRYKGGRQERDYAAFLPDGSLVIAPVKIELVPGDR